ncbi:hypothetical protein [Dermabacter hominis]|uniref:hypothetical protein n=1 Tax=Dermabacter hominis TaxID=36740 RepID=UPI0024326558|nr:hypothetical protein [Dermabacter hominis]
MFKPGNATVERRVILAILAIGSCWRGVAFLLPVHLDAAPSVNGGAVEAWTGAWPWLAGLTWLTLGLVGIASVALARWVVATALIGSALVIWGVGYALAWLTPLVEGSPTDWISTGTYLTFGGVALATMRLKEIPNVDAEG